MNPTEDQVTESFKSVFQKHAVFGCLFGSILEPRFNEHSDIDLGVYTRDKMTFSQLQELRQKLSDALDRDIDLIDMRSADPIIIMQIIRNGKLAFADSPDFYHQFMAQKISEYIDFKKNRELAIGRSNSESYPDEPFE